MAALQKEARVAHVVDLSATTRILELEPAEQLDFVGGQYLIFNSGIALPDGKLAKRAYSILSADSRQERIVVAVRRLEGPGSQWMCGRSVGDRLPFSGPWGKWLADDATPRRTLVLATDTGITAAIGLIRGQAFAPQRNDATLVWLVPDHDATEGDRYFLPDAFVEAALPAGVTYRRESLPPVGHPERVPEAARIAGGLGGFDSLFLSGDGAVIYPLRDQLFGGARLECYFNNPAKKSV